MHRGTALRFPGSLRGDRHGFPFPRNDCSQSGAATVDHPESDRLEAVTALEFCLHEFVEFARIPLGAREGP
jgi:hypothetical protein